VVASFTTEFVSSNVPFPAGERAGSRVTGSTLGATTKAYTYDASGNRLTATDGGVSSAFAYDRADQIISDTYAGTAHGFSYDPYGNLTAESVSAGGAVAATTYGWDLASRMTRITQADGTILGFTFDALGRHATRTSGALPTTIDTYGYLGTGDVVVSDVQNQAGITLSAAVDAAGDRLMTSTGAASAWLVPDLHGDVIGQTSAAGTLTDAFRYDAYGLAVGTTLAGSVPTPWRYQGRLLESTSGGRDLYDLTARSYAPDLGAFTSLDSVAGSAQNPVSLDRYLYAAANPETLVDPTGHMVGCASSSSDLCDETTAVKYKAGSGAMAAATRVSGRDTYHAQFVHRMAVAAFWIDAARLARSNAQQLAKVLNEVALGPGGSGVVRNQLTEQCQASGPQNAGYCGSYATAPGLGGPRQDGTPDRGVLRLLSNGLQMVPGAGDLFQAAVIAWKHDPISGDNYTDEQAGLAATLMLGSAGLIPAGAARLGEDVDKVATDVTVATGRQAAVRTAWRDELDLVKATGQGTQRWSLPEVEQLLTVGRVAGYDGHHINSVAWSLANTDNPLWWITNPDNITFVTRVDHLAEHGGSWRNWTTGELLDRSY
jgi:RHS repeat-associated protein